MLAMRLLRSIITNDISNQHIHLLGGLHMVSLWSITRFLGIIQIRRTPPIRKLL